MLVKKYGNLILGLLFMAVGGVYYCMAAALPPSKIMDTGPSFVPKIIAAITMAVAAVLTVTSIEKLRREKDAAPVSGDKNEYWRVLLTMAAFGVYVHCFERVGFLISTCVYLFVQMLVMAPKEKIRLPMFAVISVVSGAAIYYVFRYRLNVILPSGILNW